MSDDKFYKKEETDKIWWVNTKDTDGEFLFSFNREKVYNLFRDYPQAMTEKEVQLFDAENPFWADFFMDRKG